MAGRPEGVGSTGYDLLATDEVGALRAATPSVAFGDISPSRGEISLHFPAAYSSATTPWLNVMAEIGSSATGMSVGNSLLPSPTVPG